MMHSLSKKEILGLMAFFLLFFVLHLPGVHAPYHQDEYKWVLYAHPEITPPGTVPHPPLTEFIYTRVGPMVGDNNFRTIPFFFGLLDLLLLFYLTKTIFDKKVAFWAVGLFIISFYSLLATLMVDVDGAVMPFFFMLMCIAYYKVKQGEYSFHKLSLRWFALLIASAVLGFLIKVVFLLPVGVLALDFAIEKRLFSDKKKFLKFVLYSILGVIVFGAILVLSKYVFPFFNLKYSLGYWEHFANFSNRGWLQTFIQFVKAMLYTSPLLLLPLVFVNKNIITKARPLFIFLLVEVFFYLFAFDFSIGALDRYFQLMVVPLCIISGAILHGILAGEVKNIKKSYIFYILAGAFLLFLTQFVSHAVPPLHPKTEWIQRILSIKWNFLYPFSGGSGPLGFYMSFLFMGLTWVISLVFVLVAFFKPTARKVLVFGVIIFGVFYNLSFSEEYLFGRINGSARTVLSGAMDYITTHEEVEFVTVYNDNGGFEVQQAGKYRKRLYIDPKFDLNEKVATLNANKEHYLVVNVPRIDPTTVYQKYFDSCKTVFEQTDKSISAKLYDCRKVPDIKI